MQICDNVRKTIELFYVSNVIFGNLGVAIQFVIYGLAIFDERNQQLLDCGFLLHESYE